MNQPIEKTPALEIEEAIYLRSGELAKKTGMSPSTIRAWGAQGILPRHSLVPGSYFYNLNEVMTILDGSRENQPSI